jgi:hypothetical protein
VPLANRSFPTFRNSVDFYGSPTYADDWLQACFAKGSTSFQNGNANFAGYANDGRVGKSADEIIMGLAIAYPNSITFTDQSVLF